MPLHTKETEIKKVGAIWPDGWFLYQDDAIRGPFSTKDAFSDKTKGRALISRKGFSRWYRLDELQEIHKQAETLGLDVEDSTLSAQETFKAEIKKLAAIESKSVKASKKIVANKVIAKPIGNKTSAVTATELKNTAAEPQVAQTTSLRQPMISEGMIAYHHLQLAGRLRLGKLESPAVEAFSRTLLSLGIYFGSWVTKTASAIQWHIDSTSYKTPLLSWVAFIPVVHIFSAYALGQKVVEMEVQNGYRKTSPFTAAILAVIPPLSVYYLQNKINKHWALHIHSALAAKKQPQPKAKPSPISQHKKNQI